MAITNQIPPQERKGFFIVFEGIDGCGKSTQATKLFQFLEDRGIKAALTREPGSYGDEFCSAIRSLIKHFQDDINTLFLFLADRDYHTKNIILPLLVDNNIVLSDRYYHSTLIYQLDNLIELIQSSNCSSKAVLEQHGIYNMVTQLNMVASHWLYPDLVIIPTISNMDVLKQRITKQQSEKDELSIQKNYALLDLYQTSYHNLPKYLKEKGYEPNTEYLFVDGELHEDELFQKIWATVRNMISKTVDEQVGRPTL